MFSFFPFFFLCSQPAPAPLEPCLIEAHAKLEPIVPSSTVHPCHRLGRLRTSTRLAMAMLLCPMPHENPNHALVLTLCWQC